MKKENSKCLVLNADYSPLTVIDWKKAIIWSMSHNKKYSIDIIDFYKDDYIVGTQKTFPIPAVAKTISYIKLFNYRVNFSRKNIFVRDNYTCQYCGKKQEIRNLTYDHVVPKSAWRYNNSSPTTWTNIVTACSQCNRKKGNRTPQQANMNLKNEPFVPNKSAKYLPVTDFLLTITEMPTEWMSYIQENC